MSERRRWWERLNRALLPYMGPAQVGPYDDPPEPAAKLCPLCERPMDEHVIHRSATAATRLQCPVSRTARG